MSDNSEKIVQQIRAQFEDLLVYVQSVSQPRSAWEVEKRLVADLLGLGRLLFEMFFRAQQAALTGIESVEAGGERLPLHGLRKRSLRSVFGKVSFSRGYYYRGERGYFLLDAILNLPQYSTSDLLREWQSKLACYSPYHKTAKILHSLLGQRPSTRAIEDEISRDRDLAQTFYGQCKAPEASEEAAILVVQADGKGIPMVADEPREGRVRLGKGEKNSRKKEAIATAVYTIQSCVRTPQQVTDSLFKSAAPASCEPECRKRSGPQNKWLWATLDGKSAAVAFSKEQILKRDGEHIQARVALTDGAAPLQSQILTQLPQFVLVLDIIHAVEYLWEAANALHGEKSAEREEWVRTRLLRMLSGQIQQIIDEFHELAGGPLRTTRAGSVLTHTAAYYERNLEYMHYNVYLERGWPIGTGVIEGACRHLIKDRCELSGMRWTVKGAECLLHLRSIAENDDWEPFEAYRQSHRRTTLYGGIACIQADNTIEGAAGAANAIQAHTKAA